MKIPSIARITEEVAAFSLGTLPHSYADSGKLAILRAAAAEAQKLEDAAHRLCQKLLKEEADLVEFMEMASSFRTGVTP